MVFTNQSAARAAREEAELKKTIQEGMVTAAVEIEKGKAYVTRKIAEKDLYVRKIKAEADLLVKLAEVYKNLDLIILPSDGQNGVNPLDLKNAMKLFDVPERGGE